RNISGIVIREDNIGLDSRSTRSPVPTRAGRSARQRSVKHSIEWHDDPTNAAPEERATVADLRLELNRQNVTKHIIGEQVSDHVTSALYGLAHGLAHDWWTISGARDREFSLLKYRSGYLLP